MRLLYIIDKRQGYFVFVYMTEVWILILTFCVVAAKLKPNFLVIFSLLVVISSSGGK